MFSIKIDKDIYHGVDMINVDELIPHEKVVENKKNIYILGFKSLQSTIQSDTHTSCHRY